MRKTEDMLKDLKFGGGGQGKWRNRKKNEENEDKAYEHHLEISQNGSLKKIEYNIIMKSKLIYDKNKEIYCKWWISILICTNMRT